MWRINLYIRHKRVNHYDGPEQFENVNDAIAIIEWAYEGFPDMYWNNDLEYLAEGKKTVYGNIEQIKEIRSEQPPLIQPNIEVVHRNRFSSFLDEELWLLLRVLNTTVGNSNISTRKLASEIILEQSSRKESELKEM